MFNDGMVNAEIRRQKQPKASRILCRTGDIPLLKTTVNYSGRFFVKAGMVHLAGGDGQVADKISCVFRVLCR